MKKKLTTGPIAAGDWDEFFRRLEERGLNPCRYWARNVRQWQRFSEGWRHCDAWQRYDSIGWLLRELDRRDGTAVANRDRWWGASGWPGDARRADLDAALVRIRDFLGVPQ